MSSTTPTLDVTVVIPAFNRSGLITRTLDSVLNQTCRPAQMIVVDDASHDDTADCVRAWGKQHNFPVIVDVLAKNSGAGAARNRGIALATTTYVAFLDSDDEHLPQTLELLVRAIDANPDAVLSFGDATIVTPSEVIPRGLFGRRVKLDAVSEVVDPGEPPVYRLFDAKNTMLRASLIPTSATCFRRDAAMEVGCMPAEFRTGQDWLFWLRLSEKGRFVFYVDDLALHHRHDDNLTRPENNEGRQRRKMAAFVAMLDGSFKLSLTEQQRQHVRTLIKEVERDWRYQLSCRGFQAYVKGIEEARTITGAGLAGHVLADPKSLARALFKKPL